MKFLPSIARSRRNKLAMLHKKTSATLPQHVARVAYGTTFAHISFSLFLVARDVVKLLRAQIFFFFTSICILRAFSVSAVEQKYIFSDFGSVLC